jgi:hypothetical protein
MAVSSGLPLSPLGRAILISIPHSAAQHPVAGGLAGGIADAEARMPNRPRDRQFLKNQLGAIFRMRADPA